jgi:glycogen debranching enzyme
MSSPSRSSAEWLEADGLGGFASGTIDGVRTRRYHALLLTADAQRASRIVLVNGLEVWLETPEGSFPLSPQRYAPDVVHPEGAQRTALFGPDPWPHWMLELPNGTFNFEARRADDRIVFRPYDAVPTIAVTWNGVYEHRPEWYRNFLYLEERARGLDHVDDLASPGIFRRNFIEGEAVLALAVEERASAEKFDTMRAREQSRRANFPSRLHRAADEYLVRGDKRKTIIAGYP